MNLEDRLDAAFAGDVIAFAASAEIPGLVDTGDEVGASLAAWTLDAARRTEIYAAALALANAPGFADRIRAIGLDRRVQAIAGGAVVTLAAAAAVSLALARGRRQHPAALNA